MDVVIHADRAGIEGKEVAADATADLEGASEVEALQHPPVRSLDVEEHFPSDTGTGRESLGIPGLRGLAAGASAAGSGGVCNGASP